MKLLPDEIKQADIDEYLESYSDFSFEIRVLQKLNLLKFHCQHAGTYNDPVTEKAREFDIRAIKHINSDKKGTILRLCMAVECKNIKENFPLLVHCMPRTKAESYQCIVCSHSQLGPYEEFGRKIILDGDDTVYKEGEPVGKSSDQVGRQTNANIVGNDGDVFQKISQSINSAYDILVSSHYVGEGKSNIFSLVIPVLVVPERRIWSVTYDLSGNIVDGPKIVSKLSYYIDKSWRLEEIIILFLILKLLILNR